MRSLLYIVFLFVMASCSSSISKQSQGLDEAERLLRQNPSAVLERLNGYDVAEFGDSSVLARWALLYSEAMVANRLTAPTDTIVNIAVDYYGRHNQTESYNKARMLKIRLAEGGKADALVSALYLQKEKEFMLYKERMMRERFVFVGLFVLFLSACVIFWQYQRLRLRRVQNEALLAEASGLRDYMQNQQMKMSSLLSARFNIIDELCETYYESQGTKTERKAVADKVRTQIEVLQGDEAVLAEMKRTVNDCRQGLFDIFQNEIGNIKPDEARLFVYLACGFSNRTIALLLGESIDVIYKRKSRLKAKITASCSNEKGRLLSVFG